MTSRTLEDAERELAELQAWKREAIAAASANDEWQEKLRVLVLDIDINQLGRHWLEAVFNVLSQYKTLRLRLNTLYGAASAQEEMDRAVCERVGIGWFGCDTADHLGDEIEGLRARVKTLEDTLRHIRDTTFNQTLQYLIDQVVERATAPATQLDSRTKGNDEH